MIPHMKVALWISAACALPFILVSCGNGGGGGSGNGSQQAGIGPFDSQGRYREEWADNPSQWRRPGGSSSRVTKTDDVPQVALNEQPPLNSVPLATSSPKPTIAETKTKTTATSKKESEAVVVKTRPLNQSERDSLATKTKSKSKSEPEVTVKKKTKPEPEVVKAKSKPKPKTTVTAKSKSTRHVVKPGDSLSSIASRYGCSISALQRENGISGTLIRDGRTLIIPKK